MPYDYILMLIVRSASGTHHHPRHCSDTPMPMPISSLTKLRRATLACVALLCWAPLASGASETLRDPLGPDTPAGSGLTGPLHTVTVCTASLAAAKLFYGKALGMQFNGPIEVSKRSKRAQRALWQIPEDIDWELYLLRRPGAEGAMQIRLLVLDRPTPTIHRSWKATSLGPFAMGFPNIHQAQLDAWVRRWGFGALNVMEPGSIKHPDGASYAINETVFNGPDFVHAVGIQRGHGEIAQLGPVDPATGVGGPAYATQVVADADAWIRLLVDTLGMQLRSDRHWKSSGSQGALNIPDGSEFRFSIVYAHGASSRHILLLDYTNLKPAPNPVAPRPPNRGITMWSMPVQDLSAAMARLTLAGVPLAHVPVIYDSPALGRVHAVTVLAPNGFMLELFVPL